MWALITFFLLFLPLQSGADTPTDWNKNVQEIRLSNGMKFLLDRRGEAPIFSATIRFRAGGIDEEEGKTGLAHFLEHMAFKGTKTLDGTALSRLIEENGGHDFNATTSKDMTSYFVSYPSDKFRFWAEIESERIFRPVFREFTEEKNVVLEERRMRVDNDPDGKLYEALLFKAFEKSPYRWPTIGSEKDLLRLTDRDLESFWRRHYNPSNAVGAIVGNFDLKNAKKILEETFGSIHFKIEKEDHRAYSEEPPQKGEKRIELKLEARPRLWIGYHKPTLPDREDYIFDVIEQIIGGGRSSRLYKRLVLEKKIASSVETSTAVPGSRLPNLFLIEVNLLGNHTPEEALQALDRESEALKMEGVTEREVQKAKNRLSVDLIWGMKTNEGLASQLSYFEVEAGSWRYLARYLEEIKQIQPADVQQVARTYLNRNNRTIVMLKP